MLSRQNLPFGNSRQAEIIEVVARNGWDYFRNKLAGADRPDGKPEEFALPLPAALKQILIDLGPTFVKLGQLLSTRPDLLGPDYIKALETLQADVPALDWTEIEPILQAELKGPLASLFKDFATTPIAAGSLGQVHRAQLLDGTVVAVKIQRPGIRTVIERDLAVLLSLAEFFKGDGIGQAYDLLGLLEEFRTSILGELDFCREAKNTEKLSHNLAQSKFWQPGQVVVPRVYPEFTTERLLVLEWIAGTKLAEADLTAGQKQATATLIVQTIMQQMFLDRIFHADPHPGNFLYLGPHPALQTVDGETPATEAETAVQIALLDCGMVAILDPRTQRIVTDLLVGIVYEQPRQVAQSVRELGFTRLDVDIRALESSFDRLLRRFYTRPLEEINMAELLNEALRIPRENKIQMPGSIGLFVKALANVEGIARQLDPNFPFIEVARPIVVQALQQRVVGPEAAPEIARSAFYLSQFALDFPQRLDVLLDRIERSELGLNWRWRNQDEFQAASAKVMRRLTLALLGVGSLLSGAVLAMATRPPTALPGLTPLWSEGLLGLGLAISLWLLAEFVLRP
jgi:ubiquinone biosynthesis protein